MLTLNEKKYNYKTVNSVCKNDKILFIGLKKRLVWGVFRIEGDT